jgi:hypothetical protein
MIWSRFNTCNVGTILIYFNLTSVNLNCPRLVRSDCSICDYSCMYQKRFYNNQAAVILYTYAENMWKITGQIRRQQCMAHCMRYEVSKFATYFLHTRYKLVGATCQGRIQTDHFKSCVFGVKTSSLSLKYFHSQKNTQFSNSCRLNFYHLRCQEIAYWHFYINVAP